MKKRQKPRSASAVNQGNIPVEGRPMAIVRKLNLALMRGMNRSAGVARLTSQFLIVSMFTPSC